MSSCRRLEHGWGRAPASPQAISRHLHSVQLFFLLHRSNIRLLVHHRRRRFATHTLQFIHTFSIADRKDRLSQSYIRHHYCTVITDRLDTRDRRFSLTPSCNGQVKPFQCVTSKAPSRHPFQGRMPESARRIPAWCLDV
jgi:hypothetical protein